MPRYALPRLMRQVSLVLQGTFLSPSAGSSCSSEVSPFSGTELSLFSFLLCSFLSFLSFLSFFPIFVFFPVSFQIKLRLQVQCDLGSGAHSLLGNHAFLHLWSLSVFLFYFTLLRSCFFLFRIRHFKYPVLEGFS